MTRHRLRWGIVVIIAALINIILLVNFNTLRWPYLWPRPAVEIIVAGVVLALCFREYLTGIWLQRLVGLGMVFAGESYFLHSLLVTVQAFSLIALIHLIGVTGVFAGMLLGWSLQPAHPPCRPLRRWSRNRLKSRELSRAPRSKRRLRR